MRRADSADKKTRWGCDDAMNITQPKDQEVFWHCWALPPGLSRDEAIAAFEKKKPRDYTFERFTYNPHTGQARTV